MKNLLVMGLILTILTQSFAVVVDNNLPALTQQEVCSRNEVLIDCYNELISGLALPDGVDCSFSGDMPECYYLNVNSHEECLAADDCWQNLQDLPSFIFNECLNKGGLVAVANALKMYGDDDIFTGSQVVCDLLENKFLDPVEEEDDDGLTEEFENYFDGSNRINVLADCGSQFLSTPTHYALRAGDLRQVNHFFSRGAFLELPDGRNESAVDIVNKSSNPQIISFLESVLNR